MRAARRGAAVEARGRRVERGALRDQRHRIVTLGDRRPRAARRRARARSASRSGRRRARSARAARVRGRARRAGARRRRARDRPAARTAARPSARVSSRSTSTSWPSIASGCASVTCARSPRDSSIFASSAASRSARSAPACSGLLRRGTTGEQRREVLGDRPVEVAAAEEVVAVVADDAQQAVAGLEQRRVERAAAEVEHEPRAGAVVVGAPARRERRRDRLLEQLDALRTRRAAPPREVAALCGSSNSAGTRDHRALDRDAELIGDVLAQRLQDLGGQLLGLLRRSPPPGTRSPCPVPISRLNSAAVFAGSCSRKRRARVPTVTRPCLSIRTTDGVTVAPCALRTTRHALAVEHRGGGVGRAEIDPDVERRVGHACRLAERLSARHVRRLATMLSG